MLKIREIHCKSILTKSSLADYTLNCYVGCTHRCIYCYARYMKIFKNRAEEWGYFVDVKVNAPQVLARQIARIKPPKEVYMSSVCDGWHPLEAKYRLSRTCLKMLLEAGFEVSILTKNSLIERDFDILKTNNKSPSLGMTITAMDFRLQKTLEPCVSSSQERINTLKKAQKLGIDTWVFLGPLLPKFTDTEANLKAIFRALEGLNLSRIYIDRFNPRSGVIYAIKRGLGGENPADLRAFLYIATNPKHYQEYSQKLKEKVCEIARLTNQEKKIRFCY